VSAYASTVGQRRNTTTSLSRKPSGVRYAKGRSGRYAIFSSARKEQYKGGVNVDTRSLNTISICSGYGGIELGLRAVVPTRVVCYVEIELSAAEILAKRMEEKALHEAPIWSSIKTFDTEPWRGKVDMLTGGFPCQPFSFAGAQLGEDDPRNLWPDTARLIRGLGVPIVFLENVPGILRYYYDTIRPELREMGYEVAEGLFTASETGAPHKRQRLFILAHSSCVRP